MSRVATLLFPLFLLASVGCEHDPPAGPTSGTGGTGTSTGGDDCQTDDDCEDPDNPVCEAGTNTCVPCTSDSECPDPDYPECVNGSCAQACQSDAKDPNDTSGAASAIVSDASGLNLWLCPGTDDEDWFEFSISNSHFISILTNNDPYDGDFDVTLFNDANVEIDSSSQNFYGKKVPRAVEAVHTLITPDTYWIRVRATDGQGGIPYRLVLQLFKEG